MPAQAKQALRRTYVQMRKTLSPAVQQAASERVCARIATLHQYQVANHIAFYLAINGEINLETLWQSADTQGKHCYFPAINNDHTVSFLPATQNTAWCKKRFGILEPDVDAALALMPEQLDIIFLPLVAFDDRGTRVGMGGGFYDRTLANHRALQLIGVAYEFQHQAFIQPDSWDVPLTAMITQQTIYWSKP